MPSTSTQTKEQRLQHIENEARKLREEIEAEKKANEIDITQIGVYLIQRPSGDLGVTLVHWTGDARLTLDERVASHLPSYEEKDNPDGLTGLAKLTADEVREIVRFAKRLVENR